MKIFAGLEGGASFSKVVLIREDGQILSWVEEGPSTNYLLLGVEECQKRIYEMIESVKQEAGIDADVVLDGLGLCMSGCEEEGANEGFSNKLLEKYPQMARSCAVASDTIGSILSASPSGGIVLIAGTGSNSLLLNPDTSSARCGGWGHLLGDEGGAYWITQKAMKAVIDTEDNMNPAPHPVECVKKVVLDYFGISDTFGLLEPCYVKFNKTHFAGLCAKLVVAANDGDLLSRHIFSEAGRVLANHVVALLPKVSQQLLECDGGLAIVCVGSVFKSWPLLKDGFFAGLGGRVRELTLLQLTNSSASGAALLGAKRVSNELPIDFKSNSKVLCHFKCT